MLIITIQIFSLCLQIFSCVSTKFPVFSLSGKSKNQFPCFPSAVATLAKVQHKGNATYCSKHVQFSLPST